MARARTEACRRSAYGALVAPAAAPALRGPGRALRRDLLLGLLLHDAGVGREWPTRPRAQHARELREPDRSLRPYSKRQPDLLSQPLATAVLLIHGRAG